MTSFGIFRVSTTMLYQLLLDEKNTYFIIIFFFRFDMVWFFFFFFNIRLRSTSNLYVRISALVLYTYILYRIQYMTRISTVFFFFVNDNN